MRVIVTGGRDHTPTPSEIRAFEALWDKLGGSELVHGACPSGVDAWANRWAAERALPVRRFPADWKSHGLAAGPLRNMEMAVYAREGKPRGVCVALRGGRGTANMVAQAQKRGLRVLAIKG